MLQSNPLLEIIFEYNHLNQEQIADVLNPSPLAFTTSKHLLDIIDRLRKAKNLNQKIFICGDYDVDGLCSTSILVKSFRDFGLAVGYYIPDRFKDGYGINLDIAKQAIDKGYECILMVDNGVSAHDVISFCKSKLIDTIVVDHHEIRDEVKSDYLLHPDLLESFFESMCASGLAHQISHALVGENDYVTSLAGLATIADMMPVFKQNRVLIQNGLKLINQNRYLNILALLKDTNQIITEESLSFHVIPKLNAVGRLADRANANRVVEYLLLKRSEEIFAFATKIHELNEERKAILDQMMKIAAPQVQEQSVIVLKDESFHEGIVGIAAGKIAHLYQRPTVVLNQNGDRLKGSARSIGSISLTNLFESSIDLLSRYGGHAQAAGLELAMENYESLIERLNLNANLTSIDEDYFEASEFLNVEHFSKLDVYRPFGQNFKIPAFYFKEAKIISVKTLKKGVKYQIRTLNQLWDVLDFNESFLKTINTECSFVAKATTNLYNGNLSLTLMIEKWL